MKKYYVDFCNEVVPCYKIKKSYIPCKDYRKNENNIYYIVVSRENFYLETFKDNVYTDLEKCKEAVKVSIHHSFLSDIEDILIRRDEQLKNLKKVK